MRKLLVILLLIVPLAGIAQTAGTTLNFDGTDDYVTMPLISSNANEFTVEAWVYWYGPNGHEQVIFVNGNCGLDGFGIIIVSSSPHYLCGLFGGSAVQATNQVLKTNVWHHIAYRANYGSSDVFIDGVKFPVQNNGYTPNSPTGLTYIGSNESGSNVFNGNIDELQVWNIALSDEEIRYNMNKSRTGTEPNLLAYYKFDDGTAGADNTSDTILHNETTAVYDGKIRHFALNGNTSNFIGSTALTQPIIKSFSNFIHDGFSVNWYGVGGATAYYLDLATDSAFTNMVSGYNNVSAGSDTTFAFSGLPIGTYYVRVRSMTSALSDNSLVRKQILSLPLHGVKTVGTGGDYDKLSTAFEDIQLKGLDSNLSLQVISNITEDSGTIITLNEWKNFDGGSYSLSIASSGIPCLIKGKVISGGFINLCGVKNFTIDGNGSGDTTRLLTFLNDTVNEATLINFVDSAQNITIKNCNLANAGYDITGDLYSKLVYSYGRLKNFNFINNHLSAACLGIEIESYATNIVVKNNDFGGPGADSMGAKGLVVCEGDSILISQNEFQHFYSSYDDDVLLAGFYYSSNIICENNYMHDAIYKGSNGYGAKGIEISVSNFIPGVVIRNNVISKLAADSWDNYYLPLGILINNTGANYTFPVEIYNNTINIPRDTVWGITEHGESIDFSCGLYVRGYFSNIKFKNNIIFNELGPRSGAIVDDRGAAFFIEGASNPFSEISNNIYHIDKHSLNAFAFVDDVEYDFAAWKTFSGDTMSRNENPLFENDSLPVLQPCSYGIFHAQPLDSVKTDIFGSLRDTLLPTIGAIEYKAKQALLISPSMITDTSLTLSWTNGNLCHRAVFMKKANTGLPHIEDSVSYAADTVFGHGSQLQTSAWYCVYAGDENHVNISGLSPKKTYRIAVSEFVSGSAPEIYLKDSVLNNPINVTTLGMFQNISAFSTSDTVIYGNPDFAVTALASSGLPVSFSSSNPGVADVVSGMVHITGSGSCSIFADQAGDTVFEAAAQLSHPLIVKKALITARAIDTSRCINSTNPVFAITYNGLVYGENSSVIDNPPIATTTATITSPEGTYPVTLSGGSDDNYTFAFQSGTLTVIDNDSCSASVGEHEARAAYSVYPNPVVSQLTLEKSNPGEHATVSVYNVSGVLILSLEWTDQKTMIDFSGFTNGIYCIRIASSSENQYFKIIKE